VSKKGEEDQNRFDSGGDGRRYAGKGKELGSREETHNRTANKREKWGKSRKRSKFLNNFVRCNSNKIEAS